MQPIKATTEYFRNAWCPLFGKIPDVQGSNKWMQQLIEIIKNARKIWWDIDDGILQSVESSWPDPSQVQNYPAAMIEMARDIYGVWPLSWMDRSYVESKLSDRNHYESYYGISKDNRPDLEQYVKKAEAITDELNKSPIYQDIIKPPDFAVIAILAIKLSWDVMDDLLDERKERIDVNSELQRKRVVAKALFKEAEHRHFQAETMPHIERSERVILGAKKGGRTPRKNLSVHAKHQKMADDIWSKKPKLSKRAVAKKIAAKTGKNAEYIRQYIKRSS